MGLYLDIALVSLEGRLTRRFLYVYVNIMYDVYTYDYHETLFILYVNQFVYEFALDHNYNIR